MKLSEDNLPWMDNFLDQCSRQMSLRHGKVLLFWRDIWSSDLIHFFPGNNPWDRESRAPCRSLKWCRADTGACSPGGRLLPCRECPAPPRTSGRRGRRSRSGRNLARRSDISPGRQWSNYQADTGLEVQNLENISRNFESQSQAYRLHRETSIKCWSYKL